MRSSNPACYECPKGKDKIHTWKRKLTGRAYCVKCGLEIAKEFANEVFDNHGTKYK